MTRRILTLLFAIILVLDYNHALSQETAPTLSEGISGLTFSRGSIDVELLAEVIAEKQEELKKEGIKRSIGKAFECHSFALYNYAHSTTSSLLEYQNKDVIQKELLEHTSNFALIYSFAESYLKYAASDQVNLSVDIPELDAVLNNYGLSLDEPVFPLLAYLDEHPYAELNLKTKQCKLKSCLSCELTDSKGAISKKLATIKRKEAAVTRLQKDINRNKAILEQLDENEAKSELSTLNTELEGQLQKLKDLEDGKE